jgi:hypothetical protein
MPSYDRRTRPCWGWGAKSLGLFRFWDRRPPQSFWRAEFWDYFFACHFRNYGFVRTRKTPFLIFGMEKEEALNEICPT